MTRDFRAKSFWLSDAGEHHPAPSLSGHLELDVAIIGGGYTGLATAHELKRADSSLRIGVFESQVVGFGASGRNAGFAMTTFGLSTSLTKMLHGRQRAKEALHYAERAVDHLASLVREHQLDCDLEFTGFLRVGTTKSYVKRIQNELELVQNLGFQGFQWLDQEATRARANSPTYLGAIWEPRMALVHPAKLAWELKRLCLSMGVEVYENTPVQQIDRKAGLELSTPTGSVKTEKLVIATNSYSQGLSPTRSKQHAAFTHIILTEPLQAHHFEAIGWAGREGLEDARNLLHYYRLTPDNRLLVGGGSVGILFGDDMEGDQAPLTFEALERFIARTFPALADLKIEYRWGGPVSVPVDMVPSLGYAGAPDVCYALGYVGHGVSLSHLNGQVLRDLVLERHTDLTNPWFVNRKTLPWPPEPLSYLVAHAIRAGLVLEDWWCERGELSHR